MTVKDSTGKFVLGKCCIILKLVYKCKAISRSRLLGGNANVKVDLQEIKIFVNLYNPSKLES